MKTRITQDELNLAYEKVNWAYKNRKLSVKNDAEVIVGQEDLNLGEQPARLVFTFDRNMGSKGAWICTTDIELIDEY